MQLEEACAGFPNGTEKGIDERSRRRISCGGGACLRLFDWFARFASAAESAEFGCQAKFRSRP